MRFNLRFMFAVLAILGLLFAFAATPLHRKQMERRAGEHFAELGAHVAHENGHVVEVILHSQYVDHPPYISSPFNDRNAEYLKWCPRLRRLEINGSSISDRGLRHLSHLGDHLIYLGLHATDVTDDGVTAVLPQLGRLQNLYLSDTSVTDLGVAAIARLQDLRRLNLGGTGITDSAVPHLAQLSKLEALRVANTRMSADGVRQLRELLPACKIDY